MATIKDIAQIAGVSYTTVSNVIHGKTSHVSEQTIRQINKIIEDLHYTPNMSARALVSNASKVIAMINHLVPQKSGSFIEDPFHTAFISSIEEVLRQNGYYFMLRTVTDNDDLKRFLQNWNIDGMFLVGITEGAFFQCLPELRKRIVLIDSYLDNYYGMPNIGLEDFQGGYLATQYLIERGHTRIAFACPPILHHGVVEERLNGYRKALAEFGIPFDETLLFQREFSIDATTQLGMHIASRQDITAVFATADIMAAGIMAGIHRAGKKIPEDISIIGFDDISLCRLVQPNLTTIHQNAYRKGEIAAQFMIQLLQKKTLPRTTEILPVCLTVRDSVSQKR
ncbi:LacI family DNA-binding transcriptional regulator [Treponema brennaborense]|uniref:Transcriptional regulator, LacI family n=1 Tax=Treponema brennaborense (strain DSM 12168 / CIP 105900 / DD5/3) TaxID=906968 RepID=F4LLV2_TREBD|nr:LacI family DNA-binding transcriptional regulator [Treponema brennaborense]AEE15644.1 transcriptional regulator, LacI family [Treponema brennaborense DSM 12168]